MVGRIQTRTVEEREQKGPFVFEMLRQPAVGRIPIGLLFAILGALLAAFGLASDPAIYGRSLGINVNLWWGLILLVFGALMIGFGRRKPKAPAQEASGSPGDASL